MYIQPARLAPRARGRAGTGGERPAGAAAESRTGGSKLKLPKTLIVKVRTLHMEASVTPTTTPGLLPTFRPVVSISESYWDSLMLRDSLLICKDSNPILAKQCQRIAKLLY